jgi:hypothetical protein
MAEVFKSVIGRLTGALGNMVFRNHKDKTTVTMRPRTYRTPMDDDAIKRRVRFALTWAFSRAVNAFADLKKFWDDVTPNDMTAMNGIFKGNYDQITDTDVTNTATIVPLVGVKAESSDITLTSSLLNVVLDPIGTEEGIDISKEKTIYMAAVIFCKTPIDTNYKKYHFLSIKSPAADISLTDPLTFKAQIKAIDKQYFEKYTEHKAFITFVTQDIMLKAVNFTNTLYSDSLLIEG